MSRNYKIAIALTLFLGALAIAAAPAFYKALADKTTAHHENATRQ